MSASRCLRCALDASRPAKRLHLQARPFNQIRSYADSPSPRPASSRPTTNTSRKSSPDPLPTPTTPITRPPPKGDDTHPAYAHLPHTPLPPNVLAAHRTPPRLPPTAHGTPVCTLQLRSYSIRNLEFFADFALRVAFYLGLSARGPVPLPKKTERWTFPRANFVHKKSQENFERVTLRRGITILDGEPSVVEVWLACLRRWQFYGVGMKANVWEYEGLDVAEKMDTRARDMEKELDAMLANFGWNKSVAGERSLQDLLVKENKTAKGAPAMAVRDDIRLAKNVEL